MKFRRSYLGWVAAFLIVIVVVLAGTAAVLFPNEPVYQGRKLHAWLGDLMTPTPSDSPESVAAKEAIRQIGEKAIPFLLDDLNPNENRLRRTFRELLAKQRLIRVAALQRRPNPARGVKGFEALGEKAQSAIPALEQLLPLNPGFVPSALVAIGPAAMPAITNALAHSHPLVRWNTAVYLADAVYREGISREQAAVAVPFLVANLSDADANGRIHAAMGLNAIARMPELAVPALGALLNNSSPAVRKAGAESLGSYGVEAKAAAPALVPLLNDPDPTVASASSAALAKIDPQAAAASLLKPTINLLKDREETVRLNAVQTLSRMPGMADKSVPELVSAMLNDSSPIVRYRAASALGDLKMRSHSAVPALIKAMEDRNEFVRIEAARALGNFGSDAKAAVPILVKSAGEDSSKSVRVNARSAVWLIDQQAARHAGF